MGERVRRGRSAPESKGSGGEAVGLVMKPKAPTESPSAPISSWDQLGSITAHRAGRVSVVRALLSEKMPESCRSTIEVMPDGFERERTFEQQKLRTAPIVELRVHSSEEPEIDALHIVLRGPGINVIVGLGQVPPTLLRMMGGLEGPKDHRRYQGEVRFHGVRATGHHPDVATVFPRFSNRPDLTVWDNVILPFRMKFWRERTKMAERRIRVGRTLELVGLEDVVRLYPSQLTPGQNQRLAFARALVLWPRILLMDAPFRGLDAPSRGQLHDLLSTCFFHRPSTMVVATDDVAEVVKIADRVIIVADEPIRVIDEFELGLARPRTLKWEDSTEAEQFRRRVRAGLEISKS